MIRKAALLISSIAICLATFPATPAGAQPSTSPTSQVATSAHHQWIYQMMRDMTQEMNRMTEKMAAGELTSDQRVQTAQRMARMSKMMRRLSGLEARPAMREQEWQKQADQTRKQMDDILRDTRVTPRG